MVNRTGNICGFAVFAPGGGEYVEALASLGTRFERSQIVLLYNRKLRQSARQIVILVPSSTNLEEVTLTSRCRRGQSPRLDTGLCQILGIESPLAPKWVLKPIFLRAAGGELPESEMKL